MKQLEYHQLIIFIRLNVWSCFQPSMIVILLVMMLVYGLIFTYLGKINITSAQSEALGKVLP